MDVELIFKIAAIGIIVAVLCQVLIRSGREEQAFLFRPFRKERRWVLLHQQPWDGKNPGNP